MQFRLDRHATRNVVVCEVLDDDGGLLATITPGDRPDELRLVSTNIRHIDPHLVSPSGRVLPSYVLIFLGRPKQQGEG